MNWNKTVHHIFHRITVFVFILDWIVLWGAIGRATFVGKEICWAYRASLAMILICMGLLEGGGEGGRSRQWQLYNFCTLVHAE